MGRIGIVMNGVRNNEFGGSHIYFTQLCHRLTGEGWEITLFSYDSAFDVFPQKECFISLGKDFSTPKQLPSINSSLFGFEDEFKRLDVVHTDWWLAGPALRKLTRKHNIRYIFDSRGSLFNVNRSQNIFKWLILKFWHPDHIIFVDHVSHSTYENKLGYKRGCLVPVPIDTERFSPQKDLAARGHPFKLLFASWLRQEKGLLDLLSALEKIWTIHPEVELLIAGEGYLLEQVETVAAQDGRVTYLGRIPNQGMADVYAEADLLVYPSYFEGFPRAILEAYACGIPTVATEVGGLALLREREIGLIVQSGDVDNLAGAICQMIEEPLMYKQCAQDGQAFVIQEHSWPEVLKKITQLYETNDTGLA